VVKAGVASTAANIDRSWIGTDVAATFARSSHCDVTVVNDADAAGVAEMDFGAGKGQTGVVMMITLGTGIGTALFCDGVLVPNTELGHLKLGKREAEARAADSVRQRLGLSWGKWARRLDVYLLELERLLSPDLFILGGGVSKKSDRFIHRLTTNAEVVPAKLLNEAGIVGAALTAQKAAGTGTTMHTPAPPPASAATAAASAAARAVATAPPAPGNGSPSST
jgi:polyphosphate glucokinase